MAEAKNSKSLAIAQWPEQIDSLVDKQAEKEIELVQGAIRTIRDIRSNRNIAPKEPLVVSAKSQQENADILNRNSKLIKQLAGVKEFKAGISIVKPANAAVEISDATEIYVHNAIVPKTERKKLQKQKQQLDYAKKNLGAKLANQNFITKAKPEIVAKTKEKLAELTEQLQTIEKHLLELEK
ncbi:Valine--tRNA ligase [subsurface metagenome]